MRTTSRFRYYFDLLRADGGPLGRAIASPDWQPACEWTGFEALRKDPSAACEGWAEAAVEPVWDEEAGEPYAAGFKVSLSGPNRAETACDFDITYLAAQARRAGSQLVASGALKAGDDLLYRVLAYPAEDDSAGERPGMVVEVEDAAPRIEISEGDSEKLPGRGRRVRAGLRG